MEIVTEEYKLASKVNYANIEHQIFIIASRLL